jgi:hypothetical protein
LRPKPIPWAIAQAGGIAAAQTREAIHSGRALNHTKTGAGDLGRFRSLIPVSGVLTTTILSHPAPAGSFNHPFSIPR